MQIAPAIRAGRNDVAGPPGDRHDPSTIIQEAERTCVGIDVPQRGATPEQTASSKAGDACLAEAQRREGGLLT